MITIYLFICDQLKGIDGRSHFYTVLMSFKRKINIEIREIPILKNKICGYLQKIGAVNTSV